MKKKAVRRAKFPYLNFRKKQKGDITPGMLYIGAMMTLIAFGGIIAIAGILPTTKDPIIPPKGDPYACCDTGDGANCKPRTEKSLRFNGEVYSLLKSNIAQTDAYHIIPTDQFAPDGNRIFVNDSNRTANYGIKGCEHGKDLLDMTRAQAQGKYDQMCFGIPNDTIVYLCKDTKEKCNEPIIKEGTAFDAYYKIANGPVPKEISTLCPKPEVKKNSSEQRIIGVPVPQGQPNLQLETFAIAEKYELSPWLGSWCKPAIYLYPQQKTNVHVQVAPKGNFTLTIPEYPQNGWFVTAYPDGLISYKNQSFPYLYWEAKLPDSLITEPKQGYVIAYEELPSFFQTFLPKTGLNQKEREEFSKYWLKALPQSPYYFIGFMPQQQIDTLAPLTIEPKPDSILRVSLYFKALTEKTTVTPPSLAPFERKGFTVTEWGGLFKADKKHPNFTCIM